MQKRQIKKLKTTKDLILLQNSIITLLSTPYRRTMAGRERGAGVCEESKIRLKGLSSVIRLRGINMDGKVLVTTFITFLKSQSIINCIQCESSVE